MNLAEPMNTSESSSPILPPNLEQQAVALEFAESANSTREAADRVLEALAKEVAPAPSEVPPLPDHLKNRWKERFGKQAGETRALGRQTRGEGMWGRWISWLGGNSLAGGAFACACLAVACVWFFYGNGSHGGNAGRPNIVNNDPLGKPSILREAAPKDPAAVAEAALFLVAADGGKSFAEEWAGQPARVFSAKAEALQALTAAGGSGVLADAVGGTVEVHFPGKPVKSVAVEEVSANAAANLAAAVDAAMAEVNP